MTRSFVDLVFTVEQSVREEDRLGAYVTASGRNVGALRVGDKEIAPTGRTFRVPQFGIYRLKDGRIAEAWILADALSIVEQLITSPKAQ